MAKLTVVVSIASVLLLSVLSCVNEQAPSFSPQPETQEPTYAETPSSVIEQRTQATVVQVIDGDTIEVDIDGSLYRVRYIGVDTPERGQYGYDEATYINSLLVSGTTVELEKDVSETDKYGRLLRYVWTEDGMVNAILVANGYAQVASYPPDVKYQSEFIELQRQAERAGLGLWAAPKPSPTPTPTPTPTLPAKHSVTTNVKITKIFYDGQVPRVESDEYVEITNRGNEPQDLAGWVLMDISEGYPSFSFPTYILTPGVSIRVYTNEVHNEWGGFSFGSGKAIWNNSDPDTAILYDAQGNEVSRKSY
jgi:endonuclease YncB( thermonuclease family)